MAVVSHSHCQLVFLTTRVWGRGGGADSPADIGWYALRHQSITGLTHREGHIHTKPARVWTVSDLEHPEGNAQAQEKHTNCKVSDSQCWYKK